VSVPKLVRNGRTRGRPIRYNSIARTRVMFGSPISP
jgi:hypothetical protein